MSDIRCNSIVWLIVSMSLDRSSCASIVPLELSSSTMNSLVTFVREVWIYQLLVIRCRCRCLDTILSSIFEKMDKLEIGG